MSDTDVHTAECTPAMAGAPSEPVFNAGVPDGPEVDVAERRRAILRFVVTESEPARVPSKWRLFRRLDAVRQLRVPAAEFAAQLQREFDVADLLAARILVRHAQELRLSPVFDAEDCKFFVEFDSEQMMPIDVHSHIGVLSHPGPAALPLAALGGEMWPLPDPRESVILVESVDDLQVLLQLGFTAVISCHMETLTVDNLRQLFRDDHYGDRYYYYRLVIADWNVAKITNELRPRAGQIIHRLKQMHRVYDLNPGRRFSVWRPSVETCTVVKDALSFRDQNAIRAHLHASLPVANPGLNWQFFYTAPEEFTFGAARERLRRAIAESATAPRVSDVSVALKHYHWALNRAVVRRLYQAVDFAGSPFDNFSNMAAAELADRWIRGDELVLAAEAILTGNHPGASTPLNSEQFNERLKITSQIHKLLRSSLPRN